MNIVLLNILMAALIPLPFHSPAHAFKLPDAGQTTCYDITGSVIPCAGTGQDGEYIINPMSYTDNGNGTVTDNNTGLIWQKCSVGQSNDATCSGTASTRTWSQATTACTALNLGGHQTGWRLPTKTELINIVDYSTWYPAINRHLLPEYSHDRLLLVFYHTCLRFDICISGVIQQWLGRGKWLSLTTAAYTPPTHVASGVRRPA